MVLDLQSRLRIVLIPMWWGGFSERGIKFTYKEADNVLIPMWWGGFSELYTRGYTKTERVLIPMWWGGFSEVNSLKLSEEQPEVLIPMWWGGFSESQYVHNTGEIRTS